jgi:cytoskeletal protein RodZ
MLRAARQRRGLTLEQIAAETRIPLRHLSAIERDDLAALPGGLYRRAEVRTFAKAAGLDDKLALELLERQVAPPAVPAAPAPVRSSVLAIPRPGLQRAISRLPVRRFALPPAISRPGFQLAIGLTLMAVIVFARVAWERRALTSVDDRPPIVDLSTGQVVPAAHIVTDETADEPALPVRVPPEAGAAQSPSPGTAATSGSETSGEVGLVPLPPEPPAAAGPTELVVTTDPPGARVTVNGIGWGEAPVTIRHLSPGPKHVRITHDGYRPAERVIQLEDGGRRRITFRLSQP